jgi:ABC-2 type transport system ATP-binding protein
MDAIIQVEGLVKQFGTFTAVNEVSFSVNKGETFGIVGPNGAGKSTTLEIIEGLQRPTKGRVSVFGLDIRRYAAQIKSRIGVQLQSSAYYEYLKVHEILALLATFYPRHLPPDDLLDRVGLLDKSSSRVSQLSGGELQRFTVAASLINDPDLVILDEPTTGLDPRSRRNLWSLISDIKKRNITIVLTTHYMDEASALCDRVAIMDQGQIAAIDTPQNLINHLNATYTVKLVVAKPLSQTQTAALNNGIEFYQIIGNNTYLLKLKNTPKALDVVLDGIVRNNISIEHLEVTPVTLEDVFLELTGTELQV